MTPGEVLDDDALAAADLQHGPGRLGRDQIGDPPEETRGEPANDGIRRPVLRLVVAALNRGGQPSRPRTETSSSARLVW
jgi:hypothetical protein